MSSSSLTHLVDQKRTLIVVGSGGVGKTTTSAAFAVQAARMGKKVLVLTVDPARRLATSLGLAELGNEEVRVAPALFTEANVALGGGELWAMMLDTKSTFDALIDRHAPNEAAKRRIMANPFYAQTSTALAGSQEYMAMEKLYEVREQRDYDLIVLDTPPTPNALDFLHAADRLEDFLDSASSRLMMAGARTAGRVGLGLVKMNKLLLKGLNRFIGADTFLNLLEFIESFHEMYAGFKARAARVKEILRSSDVGFVVVSSTDRVAMDEGLFFHDQLRREGMPFGAFVVNRVREPFLPLDLDAAVLDAHLREALLQAPSLGYEDRDLLARLGDRITAACMDYATLTRIDRSRIEGLRAALGADGDRLWQVPLFRRDVHDIGSLAAFADTVFAAREASAA